MDDKSIKKRPHRNRSHCVSIRMNDAEYEELQKKVKESGQSVQSFIINAICDGTIATPEEVQEMLHISRQLEEATRQFRGVATNLNQQTHDLNLFCSILQDKKPDVEKMQRLRKSIPTPEDLQAVASGCLKYRREIESLWQSLRQYMGRQKVMPDSETQSNTSSEMTKSKKATWM